MVELQVEPHHLAIVQEILRRHVTGTEVWAFGSRTTGKAKKFSDLDLALHSSLSLDLNTRDALMEDFSLSDLPYRVDVVAWVDLPESLRQTITDHHVVVMDAEGPGGCSTGSVGTVGGPRPLT